MRKRIWVTCTGVLVVCVLLLVNKQIQHQKNAVLPEQGGAFTNQESQFEPQNVVENRHVPQTLSTASVPQVASASVDPLSDSNAINPQLLAAWQGHIEFYGKVVDENSNAIAGAKASFQWVEFPAREGNRATNAESDADGLFSLRDQRGLSLDVSVSKEGYYASRRDNDTFVYGSIGGGQFSPDPQHPVIFHLRKKSIGASLVPLKRNYRIPRDGTPVSIDLASGTNTPGENGNLVIRCWSNDKGIRPGVKYDWRCVVTIPGGGLVPIDEEYPFLAPETGYKPTSEINMPANREGWTSDVDLKFYYRLANGRYGRMTFSMIAGGQHFCMIDSVLNPSGSRNLESEN